VCVVGVCVWLVCVCGWCVCVVWRWVLLCGVGVCKSVCVCVCGVCVYDRFPLLVMHLLDSVATMAKAEQKYQCRMPCVGVCTYVRVCVNLCVCVCVVCVCV